MSNDQLISLLDVAKHTGVSASTVSRVMNQTGRISEGTRRRVLSAARAAGFRPRMGARQTTVAVVIDRLRFATYGGFCATMLTHLINELSRHEVAVEVYSENNVDHLGTRFVDGVLALSWDDSTLRHLRSLSKVPVVLVNRMDVDDISGVATDHFQGGNLVAEYLIERGHHQIGFISEELDWGNTQRLMGIRKALEARGVTHDPNLVALTEHQPLYGSLRRIMESRPTAIFLSGEDLAIEAVYVLTEVLNVRIPQDVSVIGLENENVSKFVRPPLTSLHQPLPQLASRALDLLLEMIETGSSEVQRVMLDNEIIGRNSVVNIHA